MSEIYEVLNARRKGTWYIQLVIYYMRATIAVCRTPFAPLKPFGGLPLLPGHNP